YSNGNTSWPNSGVNTVSARVGMAYLFNSGDCKENYLMPEDDYKSHWSLDVMTFAAPRKKIVQITEEPQLLSGSFLVAGVNIAPMYNFNKYFAAGVSLDAQYNESAGLQDYWVQDTYGDDIKFYRPPFHKQISAGLSARAEFIMPIFTINAGIGQYLIGPSETRRTYQTLNLKTYIFKGIYLNVGYQLCDFRYPENLKLGVGYRFRLK
ncbi:MAG: acyloxyacyl hydrolase, partial [Muribaculaceae bacterium]|nr:acyloxyacyl hydrolase [Muribaculaceae bacterium]